MQRKLSLQNSGHHAYGVVDFQTCMDQTTPSRSSTFTVFISVYDWLGMLCRVNCYSLMSAIPPRT